MDYIKRYILLAVLCISFMGCVKEPIFPVPEVKFSIDWAGISAVGQSKGLLDSAHIYLYPQFDYAAEPIVIKDLCNSLTCAIMPGTYRLIMHNAPIVALNTVNAHSYSDFGFQLPNTGNYVTSSDKLHILRANDPMQTVTIRAGGENVFRLKPVTATKNLRFTVNTSKFGTIVSASGTISGVLTSMNASTWQLSKQNISTVQLGDITVDGETLSGGAIDVLGVNESVDGAPENERIILTLYITNTDAGRPIEQGIDLTDDLQDLQGDEIEVELTIENGPEVKIDADVKQWLAGGELDFDIIEPAQSTSKKISKRILKF